MSKEEKPPRKGSGKKEDEKESPKRTASSKGRRDSAAQEDDGAEELVAFESYLEWKKKKKVGSAWAVMNAVLIEGSLFLYVTNTVGDVPNSHQDMLPEKSIDLPGSKIQKGEQGASKFNFSVAPKQKSEKKPCLTLPNFQTNSEWPQ